MAKKRKPKKTSTAKYLKKICSQILDRTKEELEKQYQLDLTALNERKEHALKILRG
jgi:hypothetical protein